MKTNVLSGILIASTTLLLAACGSTGTRMSKSTSTRVDLARSVRYIPSVAHVEVDPARVSATVYNAELAGLNPEQAKQYVVAKALATKDGDILIAPQFTKTSGSNGKMGSISVSGYAANITSFQPLNEPEEEPQEIVVPQEPKMEPVEKPSNRSKDKSSRNTKQAPKPEKSVVKPVSTPATPIVKDEKPGKYATTALNTMTVAEVEYSTKKSVALNPAELVGKNEETALKLAKEKMLRQEKMDVLYGIHYQSTIADGKLTAFSITAFPGRYVNYRQASAREMEKIKNNTEPVVLYQTIAADIQTTNNRIQLKFGTSDATAQEPELKETARATALKKYNADFLLNETFYFDYQDKVITNVTICGTPAIYTNFRVLKEGEVVDVRFNLGSEQDDAKGDEKPKGLFESLFGKMKKK